MREMRRVSGLRRLAVAATLSIVWGSHTHALVGGQYDPAANSINNAVIINYEVGAGTFYNYGDIFGNVYHNFGTLAVVANIEGGSSWNGHETLTRLNTYIPSLSTPGVDPLFTAHATGVGMVIAGSRPVVEETNLLEAGIAPGATLWSANIATSIDASTGSFTIDDHKFISAYRTALKTGLSGTTADVVNSSWGTGGDDAPTSNNHYYSVAIDALAAQTAKTVVFAAGNSGPGSNTISAPATSYNSIVVGASAYSVINPYTTVADFSSRSPTDGFIPTSAAVLLNGDSVAAGVYHPGARAAVSLLAPGEYLFTAYYSADDPTQTGLYAIEASGTSFAAPIVAGGAALLVDTGRTWFAGSDKAIDARVIKAVLMNSADKTADWNNGQTIVNGVIRTTQALDYASGAGRLNLTTAFIQYLNGSQFVDDTGSGGLVASTGWVYGKAKAGTPTDYHIFGDLIQGTRFTVTLDWFVNSLLADGSDTPSYGSFDNLDLEIWHIADGMPDFLVAESASMFENVEHLSFTVPSTGEYMIRVNWKGELYDLVNAADQDEFGLAFYNQVPEPGGLVGIVGIFGLLRRKRRRV